MKTGGEHVADVDGGIQRCGLGRCEHARRDAHRVLHPGGLLVGLDLGIGCEQEQIAGLSQIDLLSWPDREVLERVKTALTQRDVDRIGELGPHASSGLAGGSAAEVAALEQQDVTQPRLGEVEGDARAHRTAADDDNARFTGQASSGHGCERGAHVTGPGRSR